MRFRQANLGFWILLGGILLARPGLAAESGDFPGSRQFGKGEQRIGLGVGYGYGFEFLRSRDNENSEVEHAVVLPSWSVGLTDPLAAGHWYEGNVDLVSEAQLLLNHEPRSGYFGAGTLSFRYNFLGLDRFVPFVNAGAGMGYLSYDLDDQRDGFNFALQTGRKR